MQPGWYHDNLRRHFPFRQGSIDHAASTTVTKLDPRIIVDCGFMFGPTTGFQPGLDSVWLHSVTRQGTDYSFVFRTDTPRMAGQNLEFVAEYPWSRFSVIRQDVEEEECVEGLSWEGFVVLGDPLQFLADAASLQDNTTKSVPVESSCIQSLSGQFCTKIHVANLDHTRAQSPQGCRDICFPDALQDVHVVETCLTDEVWFFEGYNCSIYQNDQENSLQFSAGVGAGAGEPCQDVEVYPGETPPNGYTTLDGGLSCREVLRSFGGAKGPAVAVETGPGVALAADQENHRLIIDIDLRNVGVVRSTEIPQDNDCAPLATNPDPCDCGVSDD